MGPPELARPQVRAWVAWAFTAVEDVVYVGLGLLLTASALALLVTGVIDFGQTVAAGEPHYVALLDRILLILLVVELLYTVQISLRTHALVPEPFLLLGLISAIRRVLVLTAKFGELPESAPGGWQPFVIELGVLAALIVALVASLILLRRSGVSAVAPVPGGNAGPVTRVADSV